MKMILYLLVLIFFYKDSSADTTNCTYISSSGTTLYYNTVFFNTCEAEGQYFLLNDLKQIYIWDQANVSSCSAPLFNIPFQSNNSTFENSQIENTVFWVAEKTYDYFAQNFNWYGLDGIDSPMNLLILDRNDFGYCPQYKRIFIGKQSRATIDIIAHEIFHGISHAAVGLNSLGEAEALKESFSDIFGEVIENEILSTNDWLVNALPGNSTTAIRSFINPNQFEDAKMYLTDQYWEDGFGGQYQNAGVQNHWFYLLSTGNKNVDSIGISKAAKIVFKTLTHYLLPNATYYDVRYASIQAAQDIYGLNSHEQTQLALAWDEVGVFDLNDCIDTYIITPYDNFNAIPKVCNFISTQGNIQIPINTQTHLTAGNWVGINQDFEVPKSTTFTIKIN